MDKYHKTGLTNEALKTLAKCSTLESFAKKGRDSRLAPTPTPTSRRQLNLRTLALLFGIGGCLLALLITSLVTVRLFQTKHFSLRELFSVPAADPLLIPAERASFSGERPRTAPAHNQRG
jgi:hypothetical protein